MLASTTACDALEEMAVMLAEPIRIAAQHEKYARHNRLLHPPNLFLHSFTHTAFYRVAWDNAAVGLLFICLFTRHPQDGEWGFYLLTLTFSSFPHMQKLAGPPATADIPIERKSRAPAC